MLWTEIYLFHVFLAKRKCLRKQSSRNQELARSSYISSCIVQLSVCFFFTVHAREDNPMSVLLF